MRILLGQTTEGWKQSIVLSKKDINNNVCTQIQPIYLSNKTFSINLNAVLPKVYISLNWYFSTFISMGRFTYTLPYKSMVKMRIIILFKAIICLCSSWMTWLVMNDQCTIWIDEQLNMLNLNDVRIHMKIELSNSFLSS